MRLLRLLSALAVAVVLSAQNGPGDMPANGYDRAPDIYPGNTENYTACWWFLGEDGVTYYDSGATIYATFTSKPGTGWHGHEVGGVLRPAPVILSPNPTVTALNGCATFTVRWPPFSGWYTVEANNPRPGRATAGVNVYAKFWTQNLVTHAKTNLIEYPHVLYRNFSPPADDHHADFSTWLQPSVSSAVTAASIDYVQQTTTKTNVVDYLDVTRGSLPDGGNYDWEAEGVTPDGWLFTSWTPWLVRTGETHYSGTEVDVVNASLVIDALHLQLELQTLATQNCRVGSLDSYGRTISGSAQFYWSSKDVIHFVCKLAPFRIP